MVLILSEFIKLSTTLSISLCVTGSVIIVGMLFTIASNAFMKAVFAGVVSAEIEFETFSIDVFTFCMIASLLIVTLKALSRAASSTETRSWNVKSNFCCSSLNGLPEKTFMSLFSSCFLTISESFAVFEMLTVHQ